MVLDVRRARQVVFLLECTVLDSDFTLHVLELLFRLGEFCRRCLPAPLESAFSNAPLLVVNCVEGTEGKRARADVMRVYGMQPRHWMPAYACPRGGGGEHDNQEVIPAKAGIQEPYIQLQVALEKGQRLRLLASGHVKGLLPTLLCSPLHLHQCRLHLGEPQCHRHRAVHLDGGRQLGTGLLPLSRLDI